jgi:hypothetical protein
MGICLTWEEVLQYDCVKGKRINKSDRGCFDLLVDERDIGAYS